MKCRDLFFTLAITTAIVGALPAIASETPHTQNITAAGKSQAVSYSDLNLGGQAGAKVLLQRVRLAANQVCGPEPRVDLDRTYRNCVTDTMTRAVQGINQPLVSSLYQDKFGIKVAATTIASAPAGVTAATSPAAH